MSRKFASARIVVKNNQQMLEINGAVYPPEFVNPISYPPKTVKAWGDAGLKVVTVECNTRQRTEADNYPRPFGVQETLERLDLLFSCIPDAYVILRVNLSPSKEWVNSHPEELVLFSDGKPRRAKNTLVGGGDLEGTYSLCSKEWMKDGGRLLEEFLAGLEQSPYFDRVIGVFLGGGYTWEWYYMPPMIAADGCYGDFSEPFRAYYSDFLKRKYGSEDALRRAWRMPDADIEHPHIPNLNERRVVDAAYRENQQFRENWNYRGKLNISLEENYRAETIRGLFLNCDDYANVADYYQALNESVADTINYFARVVKRRYPTFVCGAFYSNIACTYYFDTGHFAGVNRLFDERVIDFLVAPGTYNNREPGGCMISRLVPDSMTIRSIATINENDTRTHKTVDYRRSFNGVYTPEDTVRVLKRDFARDVCDCVNGYWYDLTWGESWFSDPTTIALFSEQQKIIQASFAAKPGKHHEVAALVSLDSIHHVARPLTQMVLDYYQSTDLKCFGAPMDLYYHGDVTLPEMPDYKMYIVLNGYVLSDAERNAIWEKARRNNAVVLWLYAPGFINYDRTQRMSPDNIRDAVGMEVEMAEETITADFRVDNTHPAMKYVSRRRFYGRIDKDIHSNVWYDKYMENVSFLTPAFYIREGDGVQVLGRYCLNGKPAMAVTEQHGFRSVYCTTAVVRSEVLASLAEWAGCHLYGRHDDVLYANDHFVAVHARDDGRRTIRFPQPCDPFEVYEKRYYGRGVTEITVDMELGDTLMWSICDEVTAQLL